MIILWSINPKKISKKSIIKKKKIYILFNAFFKIKDKQGTYDSVSITQSHYATKTKSKWKRINLNLISISLSQYKLKKR